MNNKQMIEALDEVIASVKRLATELARLRESNTRVAMLHFNLQGHCVECVTAGQPAPWPCATIRAMDGEL